MTRPRVGVVGARRRRQGLGPFVVRELVAAGAEVPCFLATSEATRDAAARDLAERAGARPRGHLDLREMLEREPLDALAILSPPEAHRDALEAAVAHGLHVLCEKPLVWNGGDLAATAQAIADACDARGLVLFENCQWPYTLPAFSALHPGALAAPARELVMELQPVSTGRRMLGDCLPHVVSMVQALLPPVGSDVVKSTRSKASRAAGAGSAPSAGLDPQPTGMEALPPAELEEVRFSTRDPEAPALTVSLRVRRGAAALRARAELRVSDHWPRRAAYAVDGRWARRGVSLPEYGLCFRDRGRSVPVRDPLGLLVADFVGAAGAGDPARASRSREIAERMRLLAALVAAYEDRPERPGGG